MSPTIADVLDSLTSRCFAVSKMPWYRLSSLEILVAILAETGIFDPPRSFNEQSSSTVVLIATNTRVLASAKKLAGARRVLRRAPLNKHQPAYKPGSVWR